MLANNESYASAFDKGDLPLPPGSKVAVLACMDARLDPAQAPRPGGGRRPRDPQRRRRGDRGRDPLARDLAEPARHRGDRADPPHRLRDAHVHRRRVRRRSSRRRPAAARVARRPLPRPRRATCATSHRADQGDPFVPNTDSVRGFVYEVETGGCARSSEGLRRAAPAAPGARTAKVSAKRPSDRRAPGRTPRAAGRGGSARSAGARAARARRRARGPGGRSSRAASRAGASAQRRCARRAAPGLMPRGPRGAAGRAGARARQGGGR